MTTKQSNKMHMFFAVEELLNDNLGIISTVRKLTEAFTAFRGKLVTIENLKEEQEENLKGITQDKQTSRARMADNAERVAGAMRAYADDNNNNELKQSINFSHSDLLYGKDTSSISKCKTVLKKAMRIVLPLADYGIQPPDLNELEASIATFSLLIGKPRTSKAVAKAAGTQMNKTLSDANKILKEKIDNLMLHFKGRNILPAPPAPLADTTPETAMAAAIPVTDDVDIYTKYLNAREIIDLGKHTMHFVDLVVPKSASITVIRVVDQSIITNTGKTVLQYQATGSDEPLTINPGEFAKLNVSNGSIEVTNRSSVKDGKIRVKVFKHGHLPIAA